MFPRYDWIEASWKYLDRLTLFNSALPVSYRSDSMGPEETEALLENDCRQWLNEKPTTAIMSLANLRQEQTTLF